jgi:hypothetical protein
MANSNCLEGLRCPHCGSYEPFSIEGTVSAKVYDDGVDESKCFEWNDDSQIVCHDCGRDGLVREFKVKEDDEVDIPKDRPRPRVLIIVLGGVVEYTVDGDVDVALVDYDNGDVMVVEGFEDLASPAT